MKQRIAFGLFFMLSLSLNGWAQTQPIQSLKDCIDYGLKNFGTVRIAQYQVETAKQQSRQALGLYLPQVTGTGNFTDNIKLQTTLLPAGFAGPEPLRIALGSKYQTTAAAQLTQTIYDRSLLIGIKANKPNQDLAALNTRQTQENIVYNIATNYYQVFVAQQQIKLLKDNLERTQQVLNILKLQRDNGVIQPVDYTRTEVSFNSTRSQLSVAENDLNLATNRLKYQMGMSQEQNLSLSDSTPLTQLPVLNQSQFDFSKLVSYQQAESNTTLQRLQLQRLRAGYLPTLNFTSTYGALALGNEFPNAYKGFVGFGSFGLRLNIPIFDGFQRDAQVQQQRLTVLTQEEQQRLNVASYRLQFNNAQSQIQRTQANVQNDDRNVKLAQEVYNITTLQYKQGTKSLTDLINADTSYQQAQSNYINSLINLYQARLDLEQSEGSLLNFYNEL